MREGKTLRLNRRKIERRDDILVIYHVKILGKSDLEERRETERAVSSVQIRSFFCGTPSSKVTVLSIWVSPTVIVVGDKSKHQEHVDQHTSRQL